MKIGIIGGGISGIIAAITAKDEKNEVVVFERNKDLLKKLLLTGNGRCNYYNDNQSMDNYHSEARDILEQVLTLDNIRKVKDFYDDLGIISKNKNGYYYPYSNQAVTVKNALLEKIREKNITIVTDTYINNIEKVKDKFIIEYNNRKVELDKLIISTGSCAYQQTGSDGNGYDLVKKYHTIIKPLPALVPLISNNDDLKKASGVRCEVILELFEDNNYIKSEKGELQITDYGISGICTFNLSGIIARGLDKHKKEVIKINFVPFVDTLLSTWLEDYSKKNNYKELCALLGGFLNTKIVDMILKCSNLSKYRYYKYLSNEEKLTLINNLRHFKVEITSTKDFSSSQTVTGGVSLKEINPHTLESLKVKGLYIIGELLDIDGICGGYNITCATLTGILAGSDLK